jgi:pimeloyl-ACP methyl ester carboxylesterase
MSQENASGGVPKPSAVRLWSRKIIGIVLALFVFIAAFGLIDQGIFALLSTRRYPVPGRLVSVAGYRMNINCMGHGTPTVILESGLGGYSLDWTLVQPEVAKFTRVCAYDRAGLGWSDAKPGPRTSRKIANELSSLLQVSGITGPYVIVAHSIGGYHARIFASQNHDQIVGVVLDSSHPEQEMRSGQIRAFNHQERRLVRVGRIAMIFGLPRWLRLCGKGQFPQLESVHKMVVARECRPEFFGAVEAEMDGANESSREVADSGTLGDIPLIVLSHDPNAALGSSVPSASDQQVETVWTQMQRELTQLSSRGTQFVAKGSNHYIQIDRPDVVVDAVHRVFDEAQK